MSDQTVTIRIENTRTYDIEKPTIPMTVALVREAANLASDGNLVGPAFTPFPTETEFGGESREFIQRVSGDECIVVAQSWSYPIRSPQLWLSFHVSADGRITRINNKDDFPKPQQLRDEDVDELKRIRDIALSAVGAELNKTKAQLNEPAFPLLSHLVKAHTVHL